MSCGHCAQPANSIRVDNVVSCFKTCAVGCDADDADFVLRHCGEATRGRAQRQKQLGIPRSYNDRHFQNESQMKI